MAGDNHSEQSDASSLGAARRASVSSDEWHVEVPQSIVAKPFAIGAERIIIFYC
jgi:hypothetical protein